jgi:nucleoside-triphosphatase
VRRSLDHEESGTPRHLKVLIEGRPGAGKTTVARKTVELLASAQVPVRGFLTEELRASGTRVGFAVQAIDGDRGTLAHVDFSGPPRVGKYGVDLATFERIALPTLTKSGHDEVVIIDEIGKMELASSAFRAAVAELFDQPVRLVATIHVFGHPFTDALKRRADVTTLRVTPRERDGLPERIVAELASPTPPATRFGARPSSHRRAPLERRPFRIDE